ncbi:hypothetical protein [Actinoplanes sp. NPDC051851]|uniref:hypothetical protein n=1 Tax=Actinoplanes sp. NPDC051851 TaxID=3154753 RepID=UPI0034302323
MNKRSTVLTAVLGALTLATPAIPAVAAPPPAGLAATLLTTADLPSRYRPATDDPYDFIPRALFGHGGSCRLPPFTPAHAATTTFGTEDEYAMEVESLVEVLAEPGAGAARARVAAARSLPARCPVIETPDLSLRVEAIALPTIGDSSAALQVLAYQKAGPDVYVDAYRSELAFVADRDATITVVLSGFSIQNDTFAVTLEKATRTALGKLHH